MVYHAVKRGRHGKTQASWEELLFDYEDFLRQRKLALRSNEHPRVQAVRKKAFAGENRCQARNYPYGGYCQFRGGEVQCALCFPHGRADAGSGFGGHFLRVGEQLSLVAHVAGVGPGAAVDDFHAGGEFFLQGVRQNLNRLAELTN